MNTEKFCINCGMRIPIESVVCPYCGVQQRMINILQSRNDYEGNRPQNYEDSHQKDNYIVWSCVCSAIALLIPIVGVIAIVLGVLVQKTKRDTGTILITVGATAFIFGCLLNLTV